MGTKIACQMFEKLILLHSDWWASKWLFFNLKIFEGLKNHACFPLKKSLIHVKSWLKNFRRFWPEKKSYAQSEDIRVTNFHKNFQSIKKGKNFSPSSEKRISIFFLNGDLYGRGGRLQKKFKGKKL